MSNKPLTDPDFEKSVTLRQAYLTMFEFLLQHYKRGPWPEVGDLLSGLSLLPDGGPADNAFSFDWLDAANTVLDAESRGGYTDAQMRLSK